MLLGVVCSRTLGSSLQMKRISTYADILWRLYGIIPAVLASIHRALRHKYLGCNPQTPAAGGGSIAVVPEFDSEQALPIDSALGGRRTDILGVLYQRLVQN